MLAAELPLPAPTPLATTWNVYAVASSRPVKVQVRTAGLDPHDGEEPADGLSVTV